MNAAVENERLIANGIMFGVVAELNEVTRRVRVEADGLLTDWIPWASQRAGPGARVWFCPEVGEQVVVACPNGDPAQGIIIASFYQDAYDAPANVKEIHRTEYADGSSVEFNRETHTFTLDIDGEGSSVIVNCRTAVINAEELITLNTPEVHTTGKITAEGNIETPAEVMAGSIGLKAHHHTEQGDGAATSASQA